MYERPQQQGGDERYSNRPRDTSDIDSSNRSTNIDNETGNEQTQRDHNEEKDDNDYYFLGQERDRRDEIWPPEFDVRMQNLINENSLKAKGLQTTYMRSDIG